ncbi:uncharacterized protein DSM5745_04491 [Aspergillus mulundensis]|uniref:Uncharacterized protein n=1 Tax=Aspergillus mulundensis TaxID=1810919 RepID=A0A3D8SCU2_9EURO|nr:hypothetical protein DSM5745_04491 [Aspergillus mulundensis]RDW84165.1 hypothetical protein DSM5745_04491 [Aspergillus mulundensis]
MKRTNPIPKASKLIILTAPTDPNEANHWVLAYGPTYTDRTLTVELWTFVHIHSADPTRPNDSGFTCNYETREMEAGFLTRPWTDKEEIEIPEGKAVTHLAFKKVAAACVLRFERSWLSILLESAVKWGWISGEEKRELEDEIVVETRLDGEDVHFEPEPVRTKRARGAAVGTLRIGKRERAVEGSEDEGEDVVEAGPSVQEEVEQPAAQEEQPPRAKGTGKRKRSADGTGDDDAVEAGPSQRPTAKGASRPVRRRRVDGEGNAVAAEAGAVANDEPEADSRPRRKMPKTGTWRRK